MMDELKQTLEKTIEKIGRYRDIYQQNEQAVREQIVVPILKSLGWDVGNPEEVLPNMRIQEGIPDYALMKDGNKVLFIEVKNTSVDVKREEVIAQLAKYVFGEGVPHCVLTNGVLWFLIISFKKGTLLKERIIWEIDLERDKDKLTSVIRKMQTISKDNIENIDILLEKAQTLDKVWETLLNNPQEIVKSLMPVTKLLINKINTNYEFEDTEIEDYLVEKIEDIIKKEKTTLDEETALETSTKPITRTAEKLRRMRLKGKTFEFRYSYEILVNTANWLIENGKLKPSDCPIAFGGSRRYLINKEPKHKEGSPFIYGKRLSNGLWIETHYTEKNCIKYARLLLEKFGYTPDTLIIE